MSRRDIRTQPGVLTPGTGLKTRPPRRGGRIGVAKVARYEVPGKAIGEPSQRVRSDGLRLRIYNLPKGGCGPEENPRRRGGYATVRTTNHTVPPGRTFVFRGYQALRTWLPSFSPSGTRNRPYLSTFSKPHHHHSPWPDSSTKRNPHGSLPLPFHQNLLISLKPFLEWKKP